MFCSLMEAENGLQYPWFQQRRSTACYYQQKLLVLSICTLHDAMEITNGDQPWQNSTQNSVLWKGAESHCQVTEFLPHK
jgi:hypothetical protein